MSDMSIEQAIRILGLPSDFTHQQLVTAYKTAVKANHPDFAKDDEDRQHRVAESVKINKAYKLLQNVPAHGEQKAFPATPATVVSSHHTYERPHRHERREEKATSSDGMEAYVRHANEVRDRIRNMPVGNETDIVDMQVYASDTRHIGMARKYDDVLAERAKETGPYKKVGSIESRNFSVYGNGFDEIHDGLFADAYVMLCQKTDAFSPASRIDGDPRWYSMSPTDYVLLDRDTNRFYWCTAKFTGKKPNPDPVDVAWKLQQHVIIPEENRGSYDPSRQREYLKQGRAVRKEWERMGKKRHFWSPRR